MAEVSGRRVRERPRLGWMDRCEGGLGQHRLDPVRSEGVESLGTYVTE